MATNATPNDMPALLAMLASPQANASEMTPEEMQALKAKLAPQPQMQQPQASAPVPPKADTTPDPSTLSPSPYTTMSAMGAQPVITPEEKLLQAKLLENAQKQNSTLEQDVGDQRRLAKIREYMLAHPQRDLTPIISDLFSFSPDKGAAALKAARPDSVDELTTKLSDALKATTGSQDKLSDNELNMLKMRLQFANEKGKVGQAAKVQQFEANYLAKAGGDLDYNSKTARNLFGSSAQTIAGINKIEALTNSYPDLNKMPEQVARDIYTALAGILTKSGGNVAESQIDALMPKTAKARFANARQWLESKPTGAEMKPFIEQVLHSLQAEKKTAEKNVRNGFKNIANKHDDSINMLSPYAQAAWSRKKEQAEANLQDFLSGGGSLAAPTQALPSKSDLEAEMARRGLQ